MEAHNSSSQTLRLKPLPVGLETFRVLLKRRAAYTCPIPCHHLAEKKCMVVNLLAALGAPLVLALDEVDTIIDTTFRSDFFSMLRSWHNYRALQPIWRQLDLALVTSTEPYQFVTNRNLSPF